MPPPLPEPPCCAGADTTGTIASDTATVLEATSLFITTASVVRIFAFEFTYETEESVFFVEWQQENRNSPRAGTRKTKGDETVFYQVAV
jgi:hypothetical protein